MWESNPVYRKWLPSLSFQLARRWGAVYVYWRYRPGFRETACAYVTWSTFSFPGGPDIQLFVSIRSWCWTKAFKLRRAIRGAA